MNYNHNNQSEKLSNKYKQVNTGKIIEHMESKGFTTRLSQQVNPRDKTKVGLTKHLVRMIHPDLVLNDDRAIEFIIINSHDGKSCVQFMAGIYEFICSNGLVIGSSLFSYKHRHIGASIYKDIDRALELFTMRLPVIKETIERMRSTQLNEFDKENLGYIASKIRKFPENSFMDQRQWVTPLREAEKKDDLWTVFNVIQEKLLGGGIKYTTYKDDPDSDIKLLKNNTTRKVKSLNETVRLNQSLFEECLKLVA